jgi:hypothetical protein
MSCDFGFAWRPSSMLGSWPAPPLGRRWRRHRYSVGPPAARSTDAAKDTNRLPRERTLPASKRVVHADRVSKRATARRPMKPLAFRSNAPAGHWWEPTENSNPTNDMHPGRRRCFYLAVLKSGNRASGRPPRAQSDKRSVRGKQGSNDGLTQNLYPASKPREGTGRGPHAGISGANGTKIIAAVSHLETRPRWRQGSSRDRSTPGR